MLREPSWINEFRLFVWFKFHAIMYEFPTICLVSKKIIKFLYTVGFFLALSHLDLKSPEKPVMLVDHLSSCWNCFKDLQEIHLYYVWCQSTIRIYWKSMSLNERNNVKELFNCLQQTRNVSIQGLWNNIYMLLVLSDTSN